MAVPDRVRGRAVSTEELTTAFAPAATPCRVDAHGHVRFRHRRLYGERGLARQRATVWLTGEHLLLSYGDEPLAQYTVTYAPDRRHFAAVHDEQVFVTPFGSLQLPV